MEKDKLAWCKKWIWDGISGSGVESCENCFLRNTKGCPYE